MTTYRIWPATNGPSNADTGDAVTLGTRFTLSATGWVTHLHYWRGTTDDTGTHSAAIYVVTGGTQVSGTAITLPATGTGWQTAALPTPVQLSASTMYVVAVLHPNGRQAFTNAYWTTGGAGASGITNGIITAPNSTTAGGQGVYAEGSTLQHPTSSFNSSNYWVDVSITDTDPIGRTGTGATTATATLAATGTKAATGSGALTATGTLASAGRKGGQGAGALTATGAATSAGRKNASGTGATSATAALSSTGERVRGGTGALTATALLTAAGTAARRGTAGTAATGLLAAVGAASRSGTGALAAAGSTSAAGTANRVGAGALTATTALASSGRNPDNTQPDWDFAFGPPYTDSFTLGPPHD